MLTTLCRRVVVSWLRILRRCCYFDRRDSHVVGASRILLSRRLSLDGIGLRSVGRVFSVKALIDGGVDCLDVTVAASAGIEVALSESVVDDGSVDEHADEGDSICGGA